jgi:para-aminobenzoate synthetase component 1
LKFIKRFDLFASYDKFRGKEKLNCRAKIRDVREINLSADDLVESLLEISKTEQVCLLDSCAVSHQGSHLLIAGVRALEILEISNENAEQTLEILDEKIANNFAVIFTISYDFGLKLQNIKSRPKEFANFEEPDIFLSIFDCLIIHDYDTGKTFLKGDVNNFDAIEKLLFNSANSKNSENFANSFIKSNFTRSEYLETIEKVQELIRKGDTYQTNLTQQLRAKLPENLNAQEIFRNLRKNNSAPFAAFIKRENDFVISASPERFFKTDNGKRITDNEDFSESTFISVSPIKGTRPRGKTLAEDAKLKTELLDSAKDRAENVMIVDLLRNDIGRICKFGSVEVEKLCDLETYPTLFHLVSTINGELENKTSFSDIIRAVFPCGSITGAPKISTMRIIDELETANRGLSMGAIGYSMQNEKQAANNEKRAMNNVENIINYPLSIINSIDLSVAIRTMVVKSGEAIFNVGGGIVIDSIPEDEYEETLTKAKALLDSTYAIL